MRPSPHGGSLSGAGSMPRPYSAVIRMSGHEAAEPGGYPGNRLRPAPRCRTAGSKTFGRTVRGSCVRAGSPAGRRRPDVGGGGGNRLEAEPLQDRPAGRQRVDLKIAVAAGGGQARPVRDQGTEDPPAAPGRNGSPAP